MSASEGVYFPMMELTSRERLVCVATRTALNKLEGQSLGMQDLIEAFAAHRVRLEILASELYDKKGRRPMKSVTVGVREVRREEPPEAASG